MLFDYLPVFYAKSAVIKQAFSVLDSSVDSKNIVADDLKNQLYVNSATWGLVYWENMLGLITDTSLDYDTRRGIIKSKLLGNETTTIDMIKIVCMNYIGANVDVIEDYANYTANIKITDIIGIPSASEQLRRRLREIIPAHIDFEIEFKYNTWGVISNYDWGDLVTINWGDLPTWNGERSRNAVYRKL